MGNLIKYEIKNRKRFMLFGGIILLLLNSIIYFRLTPISADITQEVGAKSFMMMFGYALLSFGVFVVILIDAIKIFRDDLFGDTGYLLFSLPKKSSTILGAKMMTVLMEYVMCLFIIVTFGIMNVYKLIIKMDETGVTDEMVKLIKPALSWGGYATLQFMILILTIYFAMTITKSILVNNKHNRLISFVTFIGLSYLVGKISTLLNQAFPQDMLLNYQVVGPETVIPLPGIVSIIFSLVIGGSLFMGTSYLLENKINL